MWSARCWTEGHNETSKGWTGQFGSGDEGLVDSGGLSISAS